MNTTSSAKPEDLFRYARTCSQNNQDLAAYSPRLRSALQHFEQRCSEPAFKLTVSYHGDSLRSYTNYCAPRDDQVRQIGERFRQADSIWSTNTYYTSATPVAIPPSMSGNTGGRLALNPLLTNTPSWLKTRVQQGAGFLDTFLDATSPALETQKAFVGAFWHPAGKFMNRLAGSKRAGYVGQMQGIGKSLYQSSAVKALQHPVGGFLIGGTLSFVSEGDYTFMGAGRAYTSAAMVMLAAKTSPLIVKALVINAVTQVTGLTMTWGMTRVGTIVARPEFDRLLLANEQRVYASLEKMDITKIATTSAGYLWGQNEFQDILDAGTNVGIGAIEFANAWHDQIALVGMGFGDRIAHGIESAVELYRYSREQQ